MSDSENNNVTLDFLNEKIIVSNVADAKLKLLEVIDYWKILRLNTDIPDNNLPGALKKLSEIDKNISVQDDFLSSVGQINSFLNVYKFPTPSIVTNKLQGIGVDKIYSYLLGAVFGSLNTLDGSSRVNHSYFVLGVLEHDCFTSNIETYDAAVNKLKKQSNDLDQIISFVRDLIEKSTDSNNDLMDLINNKTRKIASEMSAFENRISNEIDNAKKIASEQLKLLKSFSYWKAKYRIHSDKEKSSLCSLMIVSFGLFFLVPLTIYLIKDKLPHDTGKFIDPLSIAIGVILALSFWIIRIMSKMWLSHSHLKNDAHERMVMTQTYLALSNEQGMDKDQRALFLTSVFKPVQDGIVKDDGPISPLVELIAEIKKR